MLPVQDLKIDIHLARQNKEKTKTTKFTYQELMRGITTDKKIMREYYEQIHGNKFVNLDERDKFTGKYKLLKCMET